MCKAKDLSINRDNVECDCGNRNSIEFSPMIFDLPESDVKKPSLLLHSCCGPCSTSVVERLIDDYDVTVYFYNPNITDLDEYERRLAAQVEFVEKFNERTDIDGGLKLVTVAYDPERFLDCIRGLEDEPEGGKRCAECFKLRMTNTVEFASLYGYDYFTSTLSVSPHKSYSLIAEIGRGLSLQYGKAFLDMDFKKADGFAKSISLSKRYGLYRQNYCGCEFSKRR